MAPLAPPGNAYAVIVGTATNSSLCVLPPYDRDTAPVWTSFNHPRELYGGKRVNLDVLIFAILIICVSIFIWFKLALDFICYTSS